MIHFSCSTGTEVDCGNAKNYLANLPINVTRGH